MKKIATVLSVLTLLGTAAFAQAEPEFEVTMILETNVTDDDAEVVLDINSDLPLAHVVVLDPRKRRILNVRDTSRNQLGIAQLLLETAEPSVPEVLASYEEGEYVVWGRPYGGRWMRTTVELTHDLLPVPLFSPDGDAVSIANAVVSWDPVAGAEAYIIEIEQDDLGMSSTTELPPSVSSFRIPEAFLAVGEEFDIGVGVVSEDGNLTIAESSFTVEP